MILTEYEMNKMKVLFMNYLFFVKGGADPNNLAGFFFLSSVHVTCQLIHPKKLSEIHNVYY